jgi:hypothetical protein
MTSMSEQAGRWTTVRPGAAGESAIAGCLGDDDLGANRGWVTGSGGGGDRGNPIGSGVALDGDPGGSGRLARDVARISRRTDRTACGGWNARLLAVRLPGGWSGAGVAAESAGVWQVGSEGGAVQPQLLAPSDGAAADGRPVGCEAGSVTEPSSVADEGWWSRVQGLTATLEELAVELSQVEFDGATDGQLRALLRAMRPTQDRLTALRARLAGELEHRALQAAPKGRLERAKQDARRRLRDELNLTSSEAKQTSEVGRGLRDATRAAEAFSDGTLNQSQAAIICDTLRHVPAARRAAVEEELTRLARELDVNALRREATRILGREDGNALADRDRRQHARRSGSLNDRADGGLDVSFRLYGTGKEAARTALHAFLTRDGCGERRSREQRVADAFEQLCLVALAAGTAPTNHGVRPHVQVQVTEAELKREAGVAELGYSGPISIERIRSWLHDASITTVVLDDAELPCAVSEARRNVPAAIREALRARDKGCTWPGCDAPFAWCAVAHGNRPFRLRGKLSLSNCALLCGRHHALFDRGGWRLEIDGCQVTYHRDPTMPCVLERTEADINAPP